MKVRLRITPPGSSPYPFEHAGPLVHIGRDPSCELAFPGSDIVSGRHALLELTEGGLFLTDVGSSNGTFLGDAADRLKRVRLDPGERFRLGFTGPEVFVVAFDSRPAEPAAVEPRPVELAATRPEPRPRPKPIPLDEAPPVIVKQGVSLGMLLGIGGAVLVGVGAIVLLALPKSKPSEPGKPTEVVEGKEKKEPVWPTDPGANDKLKEREPASPKKKQPEPVAVEPKKDLVVESKPVGVFVAPKDGPPTLLIQRRDPEPWGRLRDGDRIETDYHLVSLPGYRSRIITDAGVRLVLWGNVPQFSAFPPVLESAVMLHPASPGIDLELTLERGRVHLTKSKEGERRVRVRFLDESWDVTLAEPTTEVVLELWGLDTPGAAGGAGSQLIVGLFAKGAGSVKVGGREQKFSQQSQLIWSSQPKGVPDLALMRDLPAWWTDQLDPRANREVGFAMLALSDLYEALTKDNDLVDAVLTRVKESADATERMLGVSFLAALDALPHAVAALESRHAEVRGAAGLALRSWIGRGPDQRNEVLRALQTRGGYAREKAETILRLLQGYVAVDVQRPEAFVALVELLNHANLPVRELAAQNLAALAPDVAKGIAYDPAGDAAARQKAVEEWKQKTGGRVPPGK